MSGVAIASGGVFSGLVLPGTAGAGVNRGGYGPLMTDPAGVLDLPRGFTYSILQKGGNRVVADFTTYDDGQKLAGDADGAASFAIGGGQTAVVTNHELTSGGSDTNEAVPQTFHGRPVPTYNPAEVGGTSTIVLDPKNRVVSIYPSIAGTRNNCAGGPTPWGTWLTCEETTSTINGFQHGYVFEVDSKGAQTVAVPYKAMGRMAHEAVAVDPATSTVYETEDSTNGLVYRFTPNDTSMSYGSLGNGGKLQAMKVTDLYRLGQVKSVGTTLPVTWVDANPGVDVENESSLNATWANSQVTRSRKLEGCWWGDLDQRVYFTVSNERDSNAPAEIAGTPIANDGQVWAYSPATGMITLVAHIEPGSSIFDGPDNITVAPWGTVFLCEDGGGDQYVIGVDPATGDLWPFAFNAGGDNEFCGANFSPDGKTMFVNIQNPSTTYAITGPWGAMRNGQ